MDGDQSASCSKQSVRETRAASSSCRPRASSLSCSASVRWEFFGRERNRSVPEARLPPFETRQPGDLKAADGTHPRRARADEWRMAHRTRECARVERLALPCGAPRRHPLGAQSPNGWGRRVAQGFESRAVQGGGAGRRREAASNRGVSRALGKSDKAAMGCTAGPGRSSRLSNRAQPGLRTSADTPLRAARRYESFGCSRREELGEPRQRLRLAPLRSPSHGERSSRICPMVPIEKSTRVRR